ncbi:MAG: hypothetical protein AAGG46_11620, partial [Planctomycetota bacterium]
VAPLASLLRLALALDRTHRQRVEEVRCQVIDNRVEITVRAVGDAEVDLWSARRKVDLFERTFGKQVYLAAMAEGPAGELLGDTPARDDTGGSPIGDVANGRSDANPFAPPVSGNEG